MNKLRLKLLKPRLKQKKIKKESGEYMKRNIILIVIVFTLNVCWLYSISYTNRFLLSHNLVINLNKHNHNHNSSKDDPKNDDVVDYDGESFEEIGKKIEKYLKKTKLEGYGEFIAKYSVSKNVNPYLVGAIIIVNSNCDVQCTAIVEVCNNVGDLTGSSGGCFGGAYRKYNTLEDGIKDLVDYILNNFYSKDLKTPNAIYKSYNKNITWSYKVSRYMEKLKK